MKTDWKLRKLQNVWWVRFLLNASWDLKEIEYYNVAKNDKQWNEKLLHQKSNRVLPDTIHATTRAIEKHQCFDRLCKFENTNLKGRCIGGLESLAAKHNLLILLNKLNCRHWLQILSKMPCFRLSWSKNGLTETKAKALKGRSLLLNVLVRESTVSD